MKQLGARIAVSILLGLLPKKSLADAATDQDRLLKPIVIALNASDKVGRIYYRAKKCDANPITLNPAPIPHVDMLELAQSEIGANAIRDIFRNKKDTLVTEDAEGIVRIKIGSPPDYILHQRISLLNLTPEEQYNPVPAVDAILNSKEVRAAMRELRVQTPARLYIGAMTKPMPGLPHLSPLLKDITVDQAFDVVVTTFRGVLQYGACRHPGIFGTGFDTIAYSEYLKPSATMKSK